MKKTHITLTVLALSFISFPVLAEENARGPGKGGKGAGLRNLDKNGDRVITEEEAGAEAWARIGQLDKDGDGKVTGQEMMAGARGKGMQGKGKGKGNPGEFIKRMDKNGDGNLSKDEVPEQFWARISTLDKDGDSSISREEFAAGAKGRMADGGKGRGFEMADKNGDGKLTQDEAPKFWDRISKADLDKDGAVSREEMARAREMAESMKGNPGGAGKGKGKGKSAGGPTAIFQKFDGNKDGKLAEEEVTGELWARISKADTNADGLVSAEELKGVYANRGGQ